MTRRSIVTRVGKFRFERAQAVEFIEEMRIAVPGKEGCWFQTALELRTTQELIGDVAFCPKTGSHGQAYLGFTLARPFWNQGYALEATTAVLDYLFGELKLHRMIADCDTDNSNSIRLLERLGFRREAHHCESYWLGDHWGNEYGYALLDREWAAGKGPKV